MYLMEGGPGTQTVINGKTFLYFGGTSYFQLHRHPDIIQAGCRALKKYGLNSATSRSGLGTTRLLLDVEKKAASYFGTEDAAYLSSGYLTNIAGIRALNKFKNIDRIFIDENAHYCNIDGAHSIHKPVIRFSHLDGEDLIRKIKIHLKPEEHLLIATDGVFPLYGRLAPLDRYLQIACETNGLVWVDDAHGMGVLGKKGRGSCDHLNLKSDRLFFGGTLSKAFGGYGGVIPGNKEFIQMIRNGNVMNGASAPPAPAAAASLTGLEILSEGHLLREKLKNNSLYFKKGLRKLGIDIELTPIPIAAWALESGKKMEKLHNQLIKKGIFIQHLNYAGASGKVLRVVLFASHSEGQINLLLDELKRLL